jgi:nicotinamidase-related amidase
MDYLLKNKNLRKMEGTMSTIYLLSKRQFVGIIIFLSVFSLLNTSCWAIGSNTVIDLWKEVKAPEPVEITAEKLNPATTAFLILDIEKLTCNEERRPRCVAGVPAIGTFLERARSHGVFIAYSLTPKGTVESILPGVRPVGEEPIVKASVDKFFGTDLDTILHQHKIETVIIVGTTAEGAVLHTATAAAVRGFKVVVPIDGMSAAALYAEQYTAWHLLNAPGTKGKASLSKFEMIGF